MKRVVLFILLVLILPLAFAQESDIQSEYSQGETLITKISGNFIDPILKENVKFFRGFTRIPMEYDVAKIEDDFYIYALLPQPLGSEKTNYSIKIEDVSYYKGADITDEDLEFNFTISDKTAEFSANPGFILTKDDFPITIQNLQPNRITVDADSGTEQKSFDLKSGEIEKVNFQLEGVDISSFKEITLSSSGLGSTSYTIPVFIFAGGPEGSSSSSSQGSRKRELKFLPKSLDVILPLNSEATRTIIIENTGDATLKDLELSLSGILDDFIELPVYGISELAPNSSIELEIVLFSYDVERVIDGSLKIQSGFDVFTMPIFLDVQEGFIPPPPGTSDSGNEDDSDEGVLEDDSESGARNTGKIIGWILIIAIVLVIFWFWKKKYRGTKKNNVDLVKRGQVGQDKTRPKLKIQGPGGD